MDWNDDHIVEREKTKLLTKIGFFGGIVIIGSLVILPITWISFHAFFPNETQLMVSHSPNNKNKIKIVRIEDFPDPTLRINYNKKSIMKTELPNNISVEWKNDYEANVILTKKGRESDIVSVKFKSAIK